jgi:alpha-L-fucosidase
MTRLNFLGQRSSARFLIAATALVASGAVAAQDRTEWMPHARWGVMTHYLADWRMQVDRTPLSVDVWNQMIDEFDVEGLAEQIAAAGAGYHLLMIGQNSGYFLSPNATYDRFVGRAPSRCSRRDLPADMAAALTKRGVRLMVYLPAGPPGSDDQARRGLSFEGSARRNREFQRKWEAVIKEWSLRWGDKVAGWWFDGCYWPNITYRHEEPPNFESFAAAARAGNPDAAVAFNPGVVDRVLSITPFEDYSAGEINDLDRLMIRRHQDGKVDGARIHALSFLGQTWGKGAPRFSAEQVIRWSRQVVETGGAITWDVPVQRNGRIAPAYVEELKALGAALSSQHNKN